MLPILFRCLLLPGEVRQCLAVLRRPRRSGYRRVVNVELEACATAVNRSDKKAALDQLSEATAKLKRLAAGLIRQFG